MEARIDGPHGGSFYVTRACLDAIGPMDQRYFLFFEDLELGLRAKPIHGVCYAFNSVVPHIGGTTLGSSSHRARRSPLAVYLNSRNSLLFARQIPPVGSSGRPSFGVSRRSNFSPSAAARISATLCVASSPGYVTKPVGRIEY